jgi:hypothetical protein
MMNTEVRDAITGIEAAWTSYTPTWTSNGTAPALGNGTLTGAYRQIGKTVDFRMKLVMGSTTTFGTGAYFFALPVAPTQSPIAIGVAHIQDASPVNGYVHIVTYIGDAGGMRIYSPASPGVVIAATSPITFASSDTIDASGRYEVP